MRFKRISAIFQINDYKFRTNDYQTLLLIIAKGFNNLSKPQGMVIVKSISPRIKKLY